MRNLVLGLTALLGGALNGATAADGGVIVATSAAPFVAGQKDIVRVVPAAAAAAAQPRLAGPAKLVTFEVRHSTDPATVPSRLEYEIVPTGKGKVTFDLLTVTPGVKYQVVAAHYEFEVK